MPFAPPRFSFERHALIDALPVGLWDATIGRDHPMKSEAFVRALERTFPESRPRYVVVREGDAAVGLLWFTYETLDLSPLLGSSVAPAVAALRRRLPGVLHLGVAITGSVHAAEQQWWFDEGRIHHSEWAEILERELALAYPNARASVVRELDDQQSGDRRLAATLRARGMAPIVGLPLANVCVEGRSPEEQLALLHKTTRRTVRRAERGCESGALLVTRHHEFSALVDEMYPLYLQVHQRAKELTMAPLPAAFFRHVAEEMKGRAYLLVARNADRRMIGFVLAASSASVACPYLIGMDYSEREEHSLYYLLLWRSITSGAQSGARQIDLGVTAYFVKEGFGATLRPQWLFGRLRSPLLHRLLASHLTRAFSFAPPVPRSARRPAEADGSSTAIPLTTTTP